VTHDQQPIPAIVLNLPPKENWKFLPF